MTRTDDLLLQLADLHPTQSVENAYKTLREVCDVRAHLNLSGAEPSYRLLAASLCFDERVDGDEERLRPFGRIVRHRSQRNVDDDWWIRVGDALHRMRQGGEVVRDTSLSASEGSPLHLRLHLVGDGC